MYAKLSRKAQMTGQIFIYILSIVVVSLILLYGYNAIKNFGKRSEEVDFVRFKTQLESFSRQLAGAGSGSVKISEFKIPGRYTEVCFVDSYNELSAVDKGITCICNDADPGCSGRKRTIACDSWQTTNVSNVFLTPMSDSVINMGYITVDGDGDGLEDPYVDPVRGTCGSADCWHFCVPILNSKIRLRIEGKGNHVFVRKAD